MLADLTFLASSDVPHCQQVYDRHISGYGTIQLTSGAPLQLAYEDSWHTVPSTPHLWCAYPGPRLRFHLAPDSSQDFWHHRHIAFTGPQLHEWEQAGLWIFPPQPAPFEDIESFFTELCSYSRRQDRWGRLRGMNLLEGLLIRLAEARTQPDTHRPMWLEAVLEALKTQYAPHYAALARDQGMAESTLRRQFRQAMGTSLHEYAIQQRIARARVLLLETDLPMKAIATQLGYPDAFFFSRQFKEQTGVAPLIYRQSR